MNRMKKLTLFTAFFAALLLILVPMIYGQVYLGVVQGFIFNPAGATVPGASVNVSIVGCAGGSGNGCVGSATSQSNGFYIISNLNLNQGDNVSISANYSAAIGNGTGRGDASQFAYVNITIAASPSAPVLTAEPDVTTNFSTATVVLQWTNGTDQNVPALNITHQFRIDSGSFTNNNTPLTVYNLSIGSHTWYIKTCNAYECTSTVSDTFIITNNAPSAPTLQDVSNSSNTSASFNWTSGSDPEGAVIYNEFELRVSSASGALVNSTNGTTTSFNVSSLNRTVSYFWRVRTCDLVQCGSYATDTFTVSNGAPSAPTLQFVNYTNNDSVVFNWTKGTDAEGDPTTDGFQLSTNSTFGSYLIDNSSATPMLNVSLDYFKIYYWRVRTCDDLSQCSSYSTEGFFTYLGNGTVITTTTTTCTNTGSGGGGGGGGGGSNPPVCKEEWVCDDWNQCIAGGYQLRSCYDKNNCAIYNQPEEFKECLFSGPILCQKNSDCGYSLECDNGICKPEEDIKKEEPDKLEDQPLLDKILETPKEAVAEKAAKWSPIDSVFYPLAILFFLTSLYLGLEHMRTSRRLDSNVKKYVKLALKNNFSDQEIHERLKDLGWSKRETQTVIVKIRNESVTDALNTMKNMPKSPKI